VTLLHKHVSINNNNNINSISIIDHLSKRGANNNMAALKMTISCFLFLQVIYCLLSSFAPTNVQGLKVGFYDKACPKAELIVKKSVFEAVKNDRTIAAPLLRMFFHDCFVRVMSFLDILNFPFSLFDTLWSNDWIMMF